MIKEIIESNINKPVKGRTFVVRNYHNFKEDDEYEIIASLAVCEVTNSDTTPSLVDALAEGKYTGDIKSGIEYKLTEDLLSRLLVAYEGELKEVKDDHNVDLKSKYYNIDLSKRGDEAEEDKFVYALLRIADTKEECALECERILKGTPEEKEILKHDTRFLPFDEDSHRFKYSIVILPTTVPGDDDSIPVLAAKLYSDINNSEVDELSDRLIAATCKNYVLWTGDDCVTTETFNYIDVEHKVTDPQTQKLEASPYPTNTKLVAGDNFTTQTRFKLKQLKAYRY